jgi:heat shock protein HslJ
MRVFLPVLLLAVVGAACRTLPAPPNPVLGTWALRALAQGGDSLSTADGLPADLLRFEADSGVRTRSCNACSGNYVVSDNHVVLRNLACTRRACEVGRLELDRYVAGRAAYRRTGDLLVLDVDDALNGIEARLYFTPVAPGVWDEE